MSDADMPITEERARRIVALAEAVRDDLHLTGTWGWYGSVDHPYLATDTGGRRAVMHFARSGFQYAQPVFPVSDGERTSMRRGQEIPVFEVCRDATDKTDPRVYRTDVVGFRSPVAGLLAELDADTVHGLVCEVLHLRRRVAHLERIVLDETGEEL